MCKGGITLNEHDVENLIRSSNIRSSNNDATLFTDSEKKITITLKEKPPKYGDTIINWNYAKKNELELHKKWSIAQSDLVEFKQSEEEVSITVHDIPVRPWYHAFRVGYSTVKGLKNVLTISDQRGVTTDIPITEISISDYEDKILIIYGTNLQSKGVSQKFFERAEVLEWRRIL